jgi:hypothetical protein
LQLATDTQEPHGVTSQKTPFFIVTDVKTSNLAKKGTVLHIATITIISVCAKRRAKKFAYVFRLNLNNILTDIPRLVALYIEI